MADLSFPEPTLYVEHVPEYGVEDDGNGVKHRVELPGYVYFGFQVEGVKVALGRKATAGLLADIKRASDNGYTPPSKATPDAGPSAEAYNALASRVAALEAAAPSSGDTAPPSGEPAQTPDAGTAPPTPQA